MTDLPTSNLRLMRIRAAIASGGTIWANDAQWLLDQITTPSKTSARIPPPNPQLQAHVTAVAEFMQELAPYLGLDDGLVSTRDFIDAARRIREWCHDHQTLPKFEYAEHCSCCARNKITVEVFARPAVEPSGAATICGHPECDNDNVLGECNRPPEKPTRRHPRECSCTSCHYSHKFPQVKPHHATCGCFECASEQTSGPERGAILGIARIVYTGKLPPRELQDENGKGEV